MTLLVTIIAAIALIDGAAAAVPEPSCDVPPSFLASDNDLGRALKEVKSRQRLDISVIGTGSSSLPGPDGAHFAYPAQLEQALRKNLPGITVKVTAHIEPRATTAEMGKDLPKILADDQPSLVIWQAGTADAMTSVEPEDFHNSLDDGVATIENGNADVVLMNMQYSPRTETMISAPPYLDNMRVVAQQHDVPLFDRFAIMRHWNESGEFDLFTAFHGIELAKRVHDCLGRALSQFVIDAARVNPAQQN